jgi:hypothetical protein
VKIIKRILVVFVVVFALWYVATRPQEAAGAVQWAFGVVLGAGEAVVRFFTTLTGS